MTAIELLDVAAPVRAALARYRDNREWSGDETPTAAEIRAADALAETVDTLLAAIEPVPAYWPAVGDMVRPVGGYRKIFGKAGPRPGRGSESCRPPTVVGRGEVLQTSSTTSRALVGWDGAYTEWVSVDELRKL